MTAKRNFWWPSVETRELAEEACRQGSYAAFFVAGITGLFALLGMNGVEFAVKMGMDGWALVDAFIFVGVGIGIRAHSRVAAVIGTTLFIIAKLLSLVASPAGIVMGVIFSLAFISATRGTFALAKMKKSEPQGHDHSQRERVPKGLGDAEPPPENPYEPPRA